MAFLAIMILPSSKSVESRTQTRTSPPLSLREGAFEVPAKVFKTVLIDRILTATLTEQNEAFREPRGYVPVLHSL